MLRRVELIFIWTTELRVGMFLLLWLLSVVEVAQTNVLRCAKPARLCDTNPNQSSRVPSGYRSGRVFECDQLLVVTSQLIIFNI